MAGLVEDYLQRQQKISAVEKFSADKDLRRIPEGSRLYTDLIPRSAPGLGEQYAFEVNLDQCSGCKACVTACHSENGLEDDESWRSVGLLLGGSTREPVGQHITTACHHCLDPACLNGCPVNAYEKRPDTGIVKHLDDQCFGCQYCTLTCAYNVPKYSKKKGIVHKCDMCIGRLEVGQAPACVRACPGGAIRIRIVESSFVRKNPDEFVKVPEAPDSRYTLPTTKYLRKQELPDNSASADFYEIRPEPGHRPLVAMLVLTQLSVGTFGVLWLLPNFVPVSLFKQLAPYYALAALGIGLLAMTASVFHLGRPLLAFRAVLGLKKSWLSREIVAFGIFSASAVLSIVTQAAWAAAATAGFGLLGVYCSVMVYRYTRRPFWDHFSTTLKFFLTTGILGTVTGLWSTVLFFQSHSGTPFAPAQNLIGGMWIALAVLTSAKLTVESGIFFRLSDRELSSLKKTALLMTKTFPGVTGARFVCGILGGILSPLAMYGNHLGAPAQGTFFLLTGILALTLAGEFLERSLFFKTVVPLQMPGVPPRYE